MKKATLQDIEKRVLGQSLQQAMPIERAELNRDERSVTMAVTSDKPIRHWFGDLILNHEPSAIRLGRLQQGAALLLEHNRSEKIGGLSNPRTDGHVLRCDAKFSRREKAQAELDDLEDGIPRQVSGGFLVHHIVLVEQRDDDYDLYRSDDWEPIEASLVSIPADPSVGIGRELELPPVTRTDKEECAADTETESDCACDAHAAHSECDDECACAPAASAESDDNEPARALAAQPAQPVITQVRSQMDKDENKDNELIRLGEVVGEVELARDFVLANKGVAEFRDAVIAKRAAAQSPTPKPLIDLNERELRQYSITRALLADASGRKGGEGLNGDENCFEMEVSQELKRQFAQVSGKATLRGGILIPTLHSREMLQRAGLDSKTSTKGQTTVFTEFGGFIDLLRNKMKIAALGATILPGLQGNVGMPRQTGAGTFSWVAENPGSDVADSDLTLDQVTMSPKIGQSTTSYSRSLLAQSSIGVDALVQSDLANINALAIDRAAIHGSGASNQPLGLYGQSGVNVVAMGGAITFAKIVALETAVAAANGDVSTMAYLTTIGARGNAKTTQKFASTNGVPIWENGEMNGYRAEASNQVSSVMLVSAATGGSENGILFGCWDQLVLGEWGAMELITDPYRLKKQNMIEVTSFVMVDVAVRQPAAFAKGTGLTVS
jgi:HK97 family phage major capsid protein